MTTEAVLFILVKINNDRQEKHRCATYIGCERKSEQNSQTFPEENENKDSNDRTQKVTVSVVSHFIQMSQRYVTLSL